MLLLLRSEDLIAGMASWRSMVSWRPVGLRGVFGGLEQKIGWVELGVAVVLAKDRLGGF